MKRLFFLLAFLVASVSAGTIVSVTDISGDGMVHAIAASGQAHWVQITAADTNTTTNCSTTAMSACPRIGDASITTSRGIALLPSAGMFFPNLRADSLGYYNLADIYYLVQTGDKLQIIWGQ